MGELDLYLRIAVALGIGLGVGIERGWKRRDAAEGEREAGVRTFTLLSLLGAAGALTVGPAGAWPLVALALGVSALVVTLYVTSQRDEHARRGATTETAAILTFVLGALAGLGELLAAGVIGALTIALLDLKDELHGILRRIKDFELSAALKLLLVAAILLPVMPDRGYGPGAVLNPYNLLWAVVVIDALGLFGYAAMRIAGPERGAILLGFIGGFMSSTAVTLTAAKAARERPEASPLLATAVAAAQAVMFVRTAALTAVLNATLAPLLWLPALAGAATAATIAVFLFYRARAHGDTRELALGSPDQLRTAVEFVAVVVVALLVSHYAQGLVGALGLIASAIVAGAVDVDAATVSVSTLAGTSDGAVSVGVVTAVWCIALALVANSIVKAVIAYRRGNAALATRAGAALAASAAAAVAVLAIQQTVI